MLLPIPDADGILPDLRYASVDDPSGSAAGGLLWACAVKPPRRIGAVLALAVALAGCARDVEPTTFAVPRAAAAEIRMTCPPGTFIGTMTVDCPRSVPRAASVQ